MRALERIDMYVLEHGFERITFWTQRLFGLTGPRITIILTILMMVNNYLFHFTHGSLPKGAEAVEVVMINIMKAMPGSGPTLLIFFVLVIIYERKCQSLANRQFINPLRSETEYRIGIPIVMTVMFLQPFNWMFCTTQFLLWVLSMYFASCTIFPPGPNFFASYVKSLLAAKPAHA